MRIALLGYGKMGKAIEQIALNRNNSITHRIDIDNISEIELLDKEKVDVAIEFSRPESAFENIKSCLLKGIPVVSGTTGWLDKKSEIDALVQSTDAAFFYASNYSIGVNLFFTFNKMLAKIMNGSEGYETSMEEIHHTEKLDAPSGTAITLAEGIIENSNTLNEWVNEASDKANQLPIISKREPDVPGTHSIAYQSKVDTIEIKHTAHSREGFALGAVRVAEWIVGKRGVLSMEDFLKQ